METLSSEGGGSPTGVRFAPWQIAIALLVMLSLSQAAVFALANAMGFAPPDSYLLIAAAGVLLGVIEFLVLGFLLAAAVRLFGGRWSPVAVLSAFLIVPAATLVGRASMLVSSFMLQQVDGPLMARDYPPVGYLLGGMRWLLMNPSVYSVVLVFLVMVAARFGGGLGWSRAAVAGLCVAASSLAMGYLFYVGVAPSDALSLAVVDMLRIG